MLSLGQRVVPLVFMPNRKARRYILRVRPDGSARVTIPRGGSAAEAERFVSKHLEWIDRQLLKESLTERRPREWQVGTEILLRGQLCRIEPVAEDPPAVRAGEWVIPVSGTSSDLRKQLEDFLRAIAVGELSRRTLELAAAHGYLVRRVCVRNQRSRWGSCSRRGTISLNWRLLQAPPYVRDYLICHELAHLKEMNHSRRFWAEVARLDPQFRQAEAWLKTHARLLH